MQRSGCHYLRVRYEVQTSIVLEHSTQMQGRQTNGSKYIHAALRSVYCMFAIEDAIISLNFAHSPTWHHSNFHSIIANNQVASTTKLSNEENQHTFFHSTFSQFRNRRCNMFTSQPCAHTYQNHAKQMEEDAGRNERYKRKGETGLGKEASPKGYSKITRGINLAVLLQIHFTQITT